MPPSPEAIGDAEAEALVFEALEYGLAPFEVARLSFEFSFNPDNRRRVPGNRLAHRRILSDHRHRLVTTPNHDTLYSSAVLDLSQGPATLQVPAFGARYHSLAFMDAYTNNFAYIGTRSTGGEGGCYLILGPDWKGEAPTGKIIRAPSNHISLLVRILVTGPSDYAQVHRLQDALVLSGPDVARPDLIRPLPAEPANFVAVVNQVLSSDPPPAADRALLERLSTVGIGSEKLTPRQRAWWQAHFAPARARLAGRARQIGPSLQGWQYSRPSVGDFGTDYHTRAIIALQGIAANIAAESVYSLALEDAGGKPLDGRHCYRFALPSGAPPAAAFWSLSLYEAQPDGGLYFTDNALHRYALGSTSQDLRRGPDGALEIVIQRKPPPDIANWLPAPSGPFALMMRAYLPKAEMLDGRFRYAGIERLD